MIAGGMDPENVLRPYGLCVSVEEAVESLNRWYHAREVDTYDQQHAEIRFQLPPIWRQMIRRIQNRRPASGWRILDFGSGTGFEAAQLVELLGRESIADLCCYDISPEMLDRCYQRLSRSYPQLRLTTCLDDIQAADQRFNLLATNSVLHHLPAPWRTLERLLPLLTRDALWLAGHEPSSRFYRNVECCHVYERFLQRHRRRRWLSPSAYWQYARRTLGRERTPAQFAAETAVEKGVLERCPPSQLVSRMVDLHVAHSVTEARAGRGFDLEMMRRTFAGQWHLRWQYTYSFMGPFYEHHLPAPWRRAAQDLARRYPADGANFVSVWQRAG